MKNKEEIQARIDKKRREIEKLEEQLKAPKFRVRDFITNSFNPKHFGIITDTYIDKAGVKMYNYDGFKTNGTYYEEVWYPFSANDYHPTGEQILEYLIKVAELKGLVEGVEVVSPFSEIKFTIKNKVLAYDGIGLKSEGMYIWFKETNTWAKKVEVDFSILNDVDVFYVEYNNGAKWLVKGNSFGISKKAKGIFLNDNSTRDGTLCFNKSDIKTLRKVTQEEEEKFNSKFAKYEVSGVISENKYSISINKKETVFIYGAKQLADDICEFLNNRL